MICEVVQLGCVPYQEAWDWQNQLAEARGRGEISDRLILLQHPPTYTLGTSGHESNLLLTSAELEQRGITVLRVDRGGDITYHGPGQLVGYPILQLPRASDTLRADVIGYVRKIEQVIIHTLADYGVVGKPIAGLTGVWVETPNGEVKVCAIGVRINVRAVTKHGFALNLNTDLSYFDGIIPCGIRDKGVTSLAQLLGEPVDEYSAAQRLIHHFGQVFGCEMVNLPSIGMR
ncbi:MAG: lipoyl(octanoyl) transferase LipB [Chloroflexi bacterium]|nr:lipoyl(octanoyl) transferase LipB [Chloroflexota bacterium]MCC6895720.1 lipoyl(octanoyl) transferase LipB [Anaerolineae bacterium]